MADMHLTTNGGGTWKVVMHFGVPDVANAVSVNYRTALVNSGLASVSVLPDGDGTAGTISATEKADLAAGIVYEHVANLDLDGTGTTNASRVALLKERYAAIETKVVADLKSKLKFFGHNQAKV